jgi:hypothetical protein
MSMAVSVRIGLCATVLTRIPLAPKAAAHDRVKDSSAALVAGGTGASGQHQSYLLLPVIPVGVETSQT